VREGHIFFFPPSLPSERDTQKQRERERECNGEREKSEMRAKYGQWKPSYHRGKYQILSIMFVREGHIFFFSPLSPPRETHRNNERERESAMARLVPLYSLSFHFTLRE